MKKLSRLLRHLEGGAIVSQVFPKAALDRIEAAVTGAERRHRGELRVVIQGGIGPRALLGLPDVRELALAQFAQLGLGDTRTHNGVLIYMLLAERRLEIVADRRIDACVGAAAWQEISTAAGRHFAAGEWLEGALGAVEAVCGLLERHCPIGMSGPDEPSGPRPRF